jgi:hypothetical protein
MSVVAVVVGGVVVVVGNDCGGSGRPALLQEMVRASSAGANLRIPNIYHEVVIYVTKSW